eukprot:1161493-Pelagomonas_calceolata.AAC.12
MLLPTSHLKVLTWVQSAGMLYADELPLGALGAWVQSADAVPRPLMGGAPTLKWGWHMSE